MHDGGPGEVVVQLTAATAFEPNLIETRTQGREVFVTVPPTLNPGDTGFGFSLQVGRLSWGIGSAPRVDVEVHLSPDADIEVNATSGDIACFGRSGHAQLQTGGGDIRMEAAVVTGGCAAGGLGIGGTSHGLHDPGVERLLGLAGERFGPAFEAVRKAHGDPGGIVAVACVAGAIGWIDRVVRPGVGDLQHGLLPVHAHRDQVATRAGAEFSGGVGEQLGHGEAQAGFEGDGEPLADLAGPVVGQGRHPIEVGCNPAEVGLELHDIRMTSR